MKEIEILSKEEQKDVKGGIWVYDEAVDEWIWIDIKKVPKR